MTFKSTQAMKHLLALLCLTALLAGVERVEGSMVTDVVATSATNYGTDNVATMFSAVQTVGMATFQISIDVDPMAGSRIRSLGSSIWGIDSPVESGGTRFTFDGSVGASGESVDNIDNIQVVNFNANGGSLTAGDITDLSFKSITIVDGNNNPDRVKIVAGGMENAANGLQMSGSPVAVDLQFLAGSPLVSEFTVANGTSGVSNRFAVASIQVAFSAIPEPSSFAMFALGLAGLFVRRRHG